jgi:hypothetical protein
VRAGGARASSSGAEPRIHRTLVAIEITLGMPLVSGRAFQDRDALREEPFADLRRNRREGALIVNETAARLF